jgi:hypothetical protein
MTSPSTEQMMLASEWLDHFGSTWAWDDVNELVQEKPDAAWELILLMSAYAPDYGILSAIAAGPLEDFVHEHGDAYAAQLSQEAARNGRFRACLRATYLDLPPDITQLVRSDTSGVSLPPSSSTVQPTPEQLRLMIAWFHHHDTHSASAKVNSLLKRDPDGSVELLRVLLILSDEKVDLRDDVFLFVIEPFISRHFNTHRGVLVDLVRAHGPLRDWVMAQKRSPIEDESTWGEFVREVDSA